MKKTVVLFAALASLAAAVPGAADDLTAQEQWGQWRGPLATGVAPHGDPPIRWDENTNIKWKVPLEGKGSATPIVWGDSVFVPVVINTGRVAGTADLPKRDTKVTAKTTMPKTFHQFMLYCFERQTGKVRWKQLCNECVPHEGHHDTHSFAGGSPTTDGKHVWMSFGSRGIYCFDMAGKLQWKRDLGLLYTRSAFGEASTPVLHGDSLLLNWDNESNSRLIVLDATTGKTRREIPREEPTSWNTPFVVEHKGQTQVILNGTNRVRGYDLATGQELWRVAGMTVNAIPSAVAGDGVAYAMSGYNGSFAVAVPLDGRGELTGTNKLLWTHNRGTPYCPSPLLVDGKLFFTQANSNQLTCLDAKTGKVHISQARLSAANDFYGSPVAAAGRIYLVDRDGMGLVLKLSDKLEILATNALRDKIDGSPAVAGKQLFLRGHKNLYCIAQQ